MTICFSHASFWPTWRIHPKPVICWNPKVETLRRLSPWLRWHALKRKSAPGRAVRQVSEIAEVPGRDALLEAARDDAVLTLQKDPNLVSPRGQALRTLLYLFECDEAVRLFRAA